MQLISHAVTVAAPADRVWSRLIDWHSWTNWDAGIQRVKFDGPLAVGSVGRLRLKGSRQYVKLHVVSLDDGHAYTDYFDMLGTRFIFNHSLDTLPTGDTKVLFMVEAKGLTAFVMGSIMRGTLAKNLPNWMDNFKRLCERAES